MPEYLQIYRLYETDKPGWENIYFLVLDINEASFSGLLFFKDTMEMDCLFELVKNNYNLKSVDYIYDKDSKFILKLINRGTDVE